MLDELSEEGSRLTSILDGFALLRHQDPLQLFRRIIETLLGLVHEELCLLNVLLVSSTRLLMLQFKAYQPFRERRNRG